MRKVGIEIERKITTTVRDIAVKEDFQYINHYKSNSYAEISTVFFNDKDEPIQHNYYEITGELYELLMSDSDMFPPGKIKGEFRDEDLWCIVDKIRDDERR